MKRKTLLATAFVIVGLFLLSFASSLGWRHNGVENMRLDNFGNLSIAGNVNVSGYGFFGWLGSLADRVGKLFVTDLNFNGTINGSGNISTLGKICDSLGCIGDDFLNYSGVVEVAKYGADFTVIQDAVDSISVGDGEKYVVVVYPGVYEENVVLKDGVNLYGVNGGSGVKIFSNNGTVVDLGSGNSHLENLLVFSNASSFVQVVRADGGMHILSRVKIQANFSNNHGVLVNLTNSVLYFRNGCNFDLNEVGNAGGENTIIKLNGGSTLYLSDTNINSVISGGALGDSLIVLEDSRTSGKLNINGINVYSEFSSNSVADMYFIRSSSGDCSSRIVGNEIKFITSGGNGSGQVYGLDSGGNSGCLDSEHNDFIIRGFNSSKFTNVSFGDVIDSRFDTLHFDNVVKVSDAIFGSGNTKYVTSPEKGDIQLSGIVVPRTLEIARDYGEFEDYAFNFMLMNSSLGDRNITFPNTTYMQHYKDGQNIAIFNIGDSMHNVFVDPNGNSIDGTTELRVIRPGGYVEFQKVGSEIRIINYKLSSVYARVDDFANLEFWADFSDSNTIKKSGSLLDNITEKAHGYVGIPTQNKPLMVDGDKNGLSVVEYNGNNRMISFGDHELHNNSVGRGLHVFMVVNPTTTNDNIFSKYRTSTYREWYFDTNRQYIYENDDGSGYEATQSRTPELGTWNIYEISWDPGGREKVYINGYLQGTSSRIVNDISNTTSPLMIGARNLNSNDFYGKIGEIVAYSRVLNGEDRAKLVASLGAKWGIDTAVPSVDISSYWARSESEKSLSPITENDSLKMGIGNITTNGRIGIGVDSAGVKLHVNDSSDGVVFRLQDSDGTCDANPEAGSVSWSCSSDERLKKDIRDSDGILEWLMRFRIRDYAVRASGDLMTGVIAQEVLNVAPEMVSLGEDGYYKVKEVNKWKLVRAIQELKGENDLMKEDLCSLGVKRWCG